MLNFQDQKTFCIWSKSKFINMQNLIKIYLELGAILLKDLDWPKRCSAMPRLPLCIPMINKYAKFVSNIPCGSRVMTSFKSLTDVPSKTAVTHTSG